MAIIVKVTRRGQITISLKIRKKLGIKERDKLLVEVTKDGVLFRVIPRIEELAGVDSKFGDIKDVKREIEKLREEY